MLHNFPITISEKKTIAENTVEMTFVVSDPLFSFKAGQYVSIEIPALSQASVPERCHDFSIVSSPQLPRSISIVFRISESLFKKAILSLPVGGVVNMSGPKGVLSLPETTDTPLIFVAGGIGISPLLSMIRHTTETMSSQKIILLYCNSREETSAYLEELALMAKQNPNFSFHNFLGIPNKENFYPYLAETQNSLWYVVGAPAMVELVERILLESGILDKQIRIEEFSGYNNGRNK
ncbi:MAG: FAD-dependent oxidoreductase [Candidatus Paceibacterota bacterium]|jgi:ferredoxin-NADP reductase